MFTRTLVFVIFCIPVFGQKLGYINQFIALDSSGIFSDVPIYPLINNKANTKNELIPLIDGLIRQNPHVSAKTNLGLLVNVEKPKWIFRFGGSVGAKSLHSSGLINNQFTFYNADKYALSATPQCRLGFTPNKYFYAQLGFDRNFIGDGVRSLFLSDYSCPSPFASIRFNAGPLTYQMMGMYLQAVSYQKKYTVNHYVHWKLGTKFSINMFESVVFNSRDSINNRNFEFAYLNPFVVLRPNEYALGSGDNVLMGGGFSFISGRNKWYGQFIIDDLLIQSVLQKQKYWGNKIGILAGWKHMQSLLGGKFLFRMESSIIRPYTYSHIGSQLNYANGMLPLSHALGANFWESFVRVDFIKHKLACFMELSLGEKGIGAAYGGDILAPYTLRPSDYGVVLLQGLKTNFVNFRINVALSISENSRYQLFAELLSLYYKNSVTKNWSLSPIIGFRTNLWNDYRI